MPRFSSKIPGFISYVILRGMCEILKCGSNTQNCSGMTQPSKRQLKTGEGWRIGWDASAPIYKGLIGTDDWAIELTEAELDDFCRLALELAGTMQQIVTELMDEEQISCEVESDRLWLEADGFPHAYELRVMVLGDRRCEGAWVASAVPSLLQAIQTLRVF